MYIKIHTQACIYFRKIVYVYILNIFIYNINYMNIIIDMMMYIHVVTYCRCVCVYLCIHNKYTQKKTHYANKLLFCMRLIIIYIYIYIYIYLLLIVMFSTDEN